LDFKFEPYLDILSIYVIPNDVVELLLSG